MKLSDELLTQTSLFAQLSAAERDELAHRAIRRQYQKGEFIAHYQEVWPYLLLVEEGTIDLLRESEEGRSLIVATLQPNEIFWGLALFYQDAPSVVTLQARDATCLYLWSRDTLLPLLLENGKASWEFCRLLVRRMERASAILGELAFQPVAGRVARLLLDHFKDADGDRLKRDLTLDEMAARAGTTREMVCRALYNFSDKGLIRITRTEFQLTDKNGLTQLAERS
ncbi:MAG: Crp/Fnr family transcriptional regulator [Chloroflexota bacterium]|nr:Crp/Fnr family transcriptional regulator [Chloroflexota bacterium]